MAQLRDLPAVVRHMGFICFVRKVWFEITDDNLFTWASALAYSWLFALFPFLLVLLSLIPVLPYEWRVEAKNQINEAIRTTLAREAQVTIREFLDPKLNQLLFEKTLVVTWAWTLGLLATLWAASGGVAMTMSAMDRAYDVQKARPIYKQRPLAVGLTIAVATLIIAIIVLVPIGTVVTKYVTGRAERILVQTGMSKPSASTTAPVTPPPRETVMSSAKYAVGIIIWQVTRYGLAAMFMFWVVALIYHFGPNVKQRFRLLTPGSVFTVGMWMLLAVVFRVYVDTFGKYGQTYGAVGGVIILLFFFYLDALVLLVGAEINSEVDAALRAEAHQRMKPPPPSETEDTRPVKETP